MFSLLNFKEIISAFVVMFAIIDITGSIPIFLGMRQQGKNIKPWQSILVALLLFIGFFFAGDGLLHLFGVNIEAFAVAGSVVIFLLAFEMIMGVEIIKSEGTSSGASVVPVAFPLIAGPGALTAFLSLKAEYATVNIMIGLLLNMGIAYIVLRYLDKIQKLLGQNVIYIFRKFFGVILLAIGVKLFATNLAIVIKQLATNV
ncbi:MAG: MarC family protein [Bacteroidales bacterium]|nr:MarC family protein [Bacteroidales bacterium]